MPKKSDALYIEDMLTYARREADRIRGLTRDDFESTVEHQESVAYNLMIVGEAASKLSEETRAKYPTIPWHEIRGMRNPIIHGYAETEQGYVVGNRHRRHPCHPIHHSPPDPPPPLRALRVNPSPLTSKPAP